MSDDDFDREENETAGVPVEDEPLPKRVLKLRNDHQFESYGSRVRTAMAKEWAKPVLTRVLVADRLGANVKDDDQFSDLVDALYNGVRDRLTRQDLLEFYLDTISDQVRDEVDRIALAARRQTQALDSARGFAKFIREVPKS